MHGLLRSIRDWRNVKVKVSQCSDDELERMLGYAEQTRDDITTFIDNITAEIQQRSADVQARHFVRNLRRRG